MRFLRNKKGIAIEMGIFMLIVVFALCSLILTFALMLNARGTANTKNFEYSATLDAIGERFVKDPEAFEGTLNEKETLSFGSDGKAFTIEKNYVDEEKIKDYTLTSIPNQYFKDETVFLLTFLKSEDGESIIGMQIALQHSTIKNLKAELEIIVHNDVETEKIVIDSWSHSIEPDSEPEQETEPEPEPETEPEPEPETEPEPEPETEPESEPETEPEET